MQSVDEYILQFPDGIQELLREFRKVIKEASPEVTEGISYRMPVFRLKGKRLVYFAAYKNHIGFYATPNSHEAFAKELKGYKHGKGSVQFPLDKPVPWDLIRSMVEFRTWEVTGKTE